MLILSDLLFDHAAIHELLLHSFDRSCLFYNKEN